MRFRSEPAAARSCLCFPWVSEMTPILSTAPASLGARRPENEFEPSRLVITALDVVLGWHSCTETHLDRGHCREMPAHHAPIDLTDLVKPSEIVPTGR
jgi:hypothetical protein